MIHASNPISHLACIMDGNRRFAKKNGWIPWYGHKEGLESVKRSIEFCLERAIPYLSLYTFSLENFRRDPEENKYLFQLVLDQACKAGDEFVASGVKVCFIGDRALFPAHLMPALEALEHKTAQGTKLTLNLLFCYGGKQELVAGVKKIAQQVKDGSLMPEDLTEAMLARSLWTDGIPEPDIIVRTGGHRRLSNFLLYQAAYSELYFLDCLWPELTKNDLETVVTSFLAQQRNFGT